MTKKAFGSLELAILRLVQMEGRLTVGDVHKKLGTENKYTTIMTVMNRLVEKKQLDRERVGNKYEYWITEGASRSSSFFEQLKQRLFGVPKSEMVSYLIAADDVTDRDLADMEEMIKQAREKRKKDA